MVWRVQVGREVLARVITRMEANLTSAVTARNRTALVAAAEPLLAAYSDLDELLACDSAFLLGGWLSQAKQWVNSSDGGTSSYFEWQARSQISTWWPVAPSARDNPVTYTRLPVLDNYANKHWSGLVRDFYAPRVQCYVTQAMVDIPATTPENSTCKIGSLVHSKYLANYPHSLPGSDGVHAPVHWPYNSSSFGAASHWCCLHVDCGGVTWQNARYEVRAGTQLITDKNPASHLQGSFPKRGANGINSTNLTWCVTDAELDFTQSTATRYRFTVLGNIRMPIGGPAVID
jgi:hypothetical protein